MSRDEFHCNLGSILLTLEHGIVISHEPKRFRSPWLIRILIVFIPDDYIVVVVIGESHIVHNEHKVTILRLIVLIHRQIDLYILIIQPNFEHITINWLSDSFKVCFCWFDYSLFTTCVCAFQEFLCYMGGKNFRDLCYSIFIEHEWFLSYPLLILSNVFSPRTVRIGFVSWYLTFLLLLNLLMDWLRV